MNKLDKTDFGFDDTRLIYRIPQKIDDIFSPSKTDVFKILEIPYYNRYSDKTQVYSLVENDDITRRSLHVQLVAFISRILAEALCLNTALVEAIALSHDIGHTPFGHLGERYLDKVFFARTGLHFAHNIQSVRVLDKIFGANVSYQVLVGVLCHCGKFFTDDYKLKLSDSDFKNDFKNSQDAFKLLYDKIDTCTEQGKDAIKALSANTKEGLVVRICDMLAYLGKDRVDTLKVGYGAEFDKDIENSQMIMMFAKDIVENSLDKPYIAMSKEAGDKLVAFRNENFKKIYSHSDYNGLGDSLILPLFVKIYAKLYDDLKNKDTTSIIYKHHLDYISKYKNNKFFNINMQKYLNDDSKENLDLIVCDFISSMSDDYFVALCKLYFPSSCKKLMRQGYFDHNNYLTKS